MKKINFKGFTIIELIIVIAFIGILLIQGYDSRVTVKYIIIGITGSLLAAFAYSIIRYLALIN